MNEYRQQLSALIDGELNDDEMRRLQPELEAAQFSTASRYQMIAETMRGTCFDACLHDISNQVRMAILQEEALQMGSSAGNISGVASRPVFSWWRSAGGVAIAASVALALVAVVTVNGVQSPSHHEPVVASVSNSLPEQELIANMPMSEHLTIPVNDEVRPDLNSYLNAHSEFAAQDTAQGRMPYARAVSYETRD